MEFKKLGLDWVGISFKTRQCTLKSCKKCGACSSPFGMLKVIEHIWLGLKLLKVLLWEYFQRFIEERISFGFRPVGITLFFAITVFKSVLDNITVKTFGSSKLLVNVFLPLCLL